MKMHLLSFLTALAFAGVITADETAVKDDWKQLEGAWQLVSAVKDGQETAPDVVKKIRVVIRDGKHTVYFGDEPAVKEIPFTVNPATTPKSTVDTLPDGKQIRGIYKIEGDKLISCVAEADKPAPTEFASKPGSGHTLRVFQRMKE